MIAPVDIRGRPWASRSKAQPQSELQAARGVARTADTQNTGRSNAARVAGVVEHVKEVRVEAQRRSLADADRLKRGGIERPLAGTAVRHILVPPGIYPGVVGGSLHRAVLKRNPHGVGVPK